MASERERALEEAAKAVLAANMPRATLLPGSATSVQIYQIESGSVWAFDKACKMLERALSPDAEVEEIERCISQLADRAVIGDERNWNERVLREHVAALRRYAGDSRVTDGPWRKDAFRPGDAVVKSSGYEFPGVVRAAFTTSGGVVRYVVEHSTNVGLLHIFNEGQLEAAACAKPSEKGDPK